MEKYYIVKPNTKDVFDSYQRDSSKKLNPDCDVVIIEKTCTKNDEFISNVWTCYAGNDWLKIVKGRLTYDYTSPLVSPIIHLDGHVYTFSDYCKLANTKEI